MYIALATAVGTYTCVDRANGEQCVLREVDGVHMLHKADSGRHSHSSRVDGDVNTRLKLLSVFRRAELMCWSLYIRLRGVRW